MFWTFRWWKIRSFFQSRSWRKDDIYWLLRSSCFELFGDGKYDPFFSQKVDGKMIFTWSFWAFYDIPGSGKCGFSRSDKLRHCIFLARQFKVSCIENLYYLQLADTRQSIYPLHSNIPTEQVHPHKCFFLENYNMGPTKLKIFNILGRSFHFVFWNILFFKTV